MRNAKAGSFDGSFNVMRTMTGTVGGKPREWRRDDVRQNKVSEVGHLLESGALVPADKDTAAAVSTYFEQEIAVGQAVGPVAAIRSLTDPVVDQADHADEPAIDAKKFEKDHTAKQLKAIAEKEGVEVESDDNKADLVRKIFATRDEKAAPVNSNKAEKPVDANKAEADNSADKSK